MTKRKGAGELPAPVGRGLGRGEGQWTMIRMANMKKNMLFQYDMIRYLKVVIFLMTNILSV